MNLVKTFPKRIEPTEEEIKMDEEYAQAGACKRAIEQNRNTLRHGGHPMIKKEDDEIRCEGYIHSMTFSVCQKCEKCKIQYGHPFDPYWNDKESFVEYDEESKRSHKILNDITSAFCSKSYYDLQENIKEEKK